MKTFRIILRILGSLALAGYILFLAGEGLPTIRNVTFADISVYLLFAFFLGGFVLSWKNELLAGILFVLWHGLQWTLVFWVWIDAALTLIFGLPIAIIGILFIIYGIRKRIVSSTTT